MFMKYIYQDNWKSYRAVIIIKIKVQLLNIKRFYLLKNYISILCSK